MSKKETQQLEVNHQQEINQQQEKKKKININLSPRLKRIYVEKRDPTSGIRDELKKVSVEALKEIEKINLEKLKRMDVITQPLRDFEKGKNRRVDQNEIIKEYIHENQKSIKDKNDILEDYGVSSMFSFVDMTSIKYFSEKTVTYFIKAGELAYVRQTELFIDGTMFLSPYSADEIKVLIHESEAGIEEREGVSFINRQLNLLRVTEEMNNDAMIKEVLANSKSIK